MIRVLKPGILTTVQDLGRYGYAHLGLSPAGAADPLSLRAANLLVGNAENAAALECTLAGPTLEFEVDATVAITGSATATNLPLNQAFAVNRGDRLEFGSLTSGARAYLAIRGGIDVPIVMGSASTFLPAAIGGHQGRQLRTGDELRIGHQVFGPIRRLRQGVAFHAEGPLRIIMSSQIGWFGMEALEAMTASVYTISDNSNRSGLRLAGPAIQAREQRELITEGVALGAIQVPSDGQPIILFVDQQTTGGYPKIANVIAADLARLGQLRPRDAIQFQQAAFHDAIELLRQQERRFREAFEA